MKHALLLGLIASLTVASGCGGESGTPSSNANSTPNLQHGAWEFSGTTQPTSTGIVYSWLIEAIITPQGSQFGVFGNDLLFVVQTNNQGINNYEFGGICEFGPSGKDNLSGSVSGSSFTLTFSDALDSYSGAGTITSNASVSGTYTASSSSDCPYSGSFVGSTVPQSPSGNFAGALNFPNGAIDLVEITVTASNSPNDLSLTITGNSMGTDSGPFTLSGLVVANGMEFAGNIQNNAVSLYGLYVPSQKAIVVADVTSGQRIGTLYAP